MESRTWRSIFPSPTIGSRRRRPSLFLSLYRRRLQSQSGDGKMVTARWSRVQGSGGISFLVMEPPDP